MTKFSRLLTATAVAALSIAAPASAATLNFVLTGSNTASFQLPADPLMPSASTDTTFFRTITFNNVAGMFGGQSATATNIRFDNRQGPALVINGSPLGIASFQGPDLFTGGGASAMFNLGTFNLTSATLGGNFQLTISQVAAIPEPATWAMMIAGFGLVGSAMRRRAPRTAVAA